MADTLEPNSPSSPKVAFDDEALRFIRLARGENSPPTSCMTKISQFFAAVILLPIRILLILIVLPLILLIYRISIHCCGSSKKSALQCHTAAELICLRITHLPWRLFLACFGIAWIRVHRPVGHKAQNLTIVANHVAAIDGPLLNVALGATTGVAISWAIKAPVFHTVARAHHVLAVEREGEASNMPSNMPKTKVSPEIEVAEKPKTKTETIMEYQKKCASDSGFLPLLVFPEATTKNPNCLVKFRSGAFVAGEPVQPVAVLWPDEGFGWSDHLGWHLWYLITRWWTCVDIHMLPPYIPNDDECKNPTLYAQNVQSAIANKMGLKPEDSSIIVGSGELRKYFLSHVKNAKTV